MLLNENVFTLLRQRFAHFICHNFVNNFKKIPGLGSLGPPGYATGAQIGFLR